MRRVEPVIDAWFDSGSMPSAQWGYPLAPGSEEHFVYPADFICEAIDQTRGWFYSLLAVNTLVRGSTPYRNVLCLGHIVDADGRKMSKSIGQRHRPLGDPRPPGAPTRCAGGCSRRGRRGRRPGSASRSSTRPCGTRC